MINDCFWHFMLTNFFIFFFQIMFMSFYYTNNYIFVQYWVDFTRSIIELLLLLSLSEYKYGPASFMVLIVEVHIQNWYHILWRINQQGIILFFFCSLFSGKYFKFWCEYCLLYFLLQFFFFFITRLFSYPNMIPFPFF